MRYCFCTAYLSSCHRTASGANLFDDSHTFHCIDYFVSGGIRTCLGVSDDPMLLRISSNSCSQNLLLVRSHQEEIINVKRLIQESKSVTRVPVEPKSFHQSCRKNNAFTLSATLPSSLYNIAHSQIISINKNCSKSFLYNRYSLKETARHPARVIYIAADDRVFAARLWI